LCVCAGVSAPAQGKKAELKSYLDEVTERGRNLYAYDQAAWHGTDAFLALHPNTEGLARYVCVKTATGWMVVFPKWNVAHDHLIAVYVARETDQPGIFKATANETSRETSDDIVPLERALETAFRDFKGAGRPYNSAVLPAPNGQHYVYLYPGQTKDTVWPLGGDVRYTISADGVAIIERRQLHKSILDMEFPPDEKVVGGVHSHILSDVPEDTDVFYVLERRPLMPEYIGTSKRNYVIETDGSIRITKK